MSKRRRQRKRRKPNGNAMLRGNHAILGMDIVSFSRFHDDDQVVAIRILMRWLQESLRYHSIDEESYRWSPAGDGGYLTFGSAPACRKAIDVAFSICEKVRRPDWVPRHGNRIELRMGLHAGSIEEARELGRDTNIWGIGINMTSRIVDVAAPNQLLVSKQYFDAYVKAQREDEFDFGATHSRTVKHGVDVEIMNGHRNDLFIGTAAAQNRQWECIRTVWDKTIQQYESLVRDAMRSDNPLAAITAAKFLLELGQEAPVRNLCYAIGNTTVEPDVDYPLQRHSMFSMMPPHVLADVIRIAVPAKFSAGSLICAEGDHADSIFFPVSGSIVVEVPGLDRPIPVPQGQVVGEFSLWISDIQRTATMRAVDDCLLLRVGAKSFSAVMDNSPEGVAEMIHQTVKQRVVENVLNSKTLFPALALEDRQRLHRIVKCQKHAEGDVLSLKSDTYILFNGAAEISPPGFRQHRVEARGRFGQEEVLGILAVTADGALRPDGDQAELIRESVTVSFPHQVLQELQADNFAIRISWNGLNGQRLGILGRKTSQSKTDESKTAPTASGRRNEPDGRS